jgi:hypothetical protein
VSFFRKTIDIDVPKDHPLELDAAVSWLELWPDLTETGTRERRLIAAVKCLKFHLAQDDPTWEQYTIRVPIFNERFWRTLSQADFGSHPQIYHTRILKCLLQILTGRDIDIEEHSMAPQVINLNGNRHTKWNAYVFQMGIGTEDRRCSRIYFSRTGGTLLYEYCEDAHN